jgi:hypothetical protein
MSTPRSCTTQVPSFCFFDPHIRLAKDAENLARAGRLEQVAYQHIRGDVGEMYLECRDGRLLDERLRFWVESESCIQEYLIAICSVANLLT